MNRKWRSWWESDPAWVRRRFRVRCIYKLSARHASVVRRAPILGAGAFELATMDRVVRSLLQIARLAAAWKAALRRWMR